jgi:hypothetical protein
VSRLHRNNAAEWVMVIVLTPVAWAVRAWRWCFHSRQKEEPVTKRLTPPRRKPMIEGLPPRNMN